MTIQEAITGYLRFAGIKEMHIAAALIDCDGVLFDTEKISWRAARRAADAIGFAMTEAQQQSFIGMNMRDYKKKLTEYIGDEAAADEYLRVFDEQSQKIIDTEGIPLKPGAREILEYLKTKDYTVALASSTKRARVEENLRRTDFRKYFGVVFGGDNVRHSKPSPDIYLAACGEVGVDPRKAYAVEDSFNGVRSAHAAGMGCIMVPDIVPPTDEIRAMCAFVFNDLFEMMEKF